MPKYEAPFNDEQRVAAVKRLAITGQQDIDDGNPLLSASMVDTLRIFGVKFEGAYSVVAAQQLARTTELNQRVAAIERLKTHVRDFREGLRRRVYRLNLPVGVFEAYHLQQDGSVDEPTTYEGWLVAGTQCVTGDAAAVAAGYTAMSNPSAAEVAAAMATAQAESDDVALADRHLDSAQATLAEQRVEADQLIADALEDLRYQTRKLDAASQRRVLRTYGAQFRYLPGEPVDEEPMAEPVAA